MTQKENDLRLDMLNTLLTTPHRKLGETWPVHEMLVQLDPRFYVRLAAWYADHGDVRDHKELFVVALVLSGFEGHRDVGLALLRRLPPYEVARVLDFIHGRKADRKVKGEAEAVVDSFGLFRNPPRSLRTEIVRYLREREAQPEWFDGTALVARKALKRMYALLHVRPSERAQMILFDGEPPADSRLAALRALSQAKTPADQARAIVEHAIPYRVAATVVPRMSPTVLLALVDRMSPQELINNLGALKRRGAFDNPEIKVLIDAKLNEAKSADRVSAFKADRAVRVADLGDDVREKLEAVADAQVKARGRITRPTALLIDKSGSMSMAIELGKRLGALISAACESELYVYAFDTIAYPVERGGDDLASWERALKGITAGGGTSCGAAVETLRRKRIAVEQIIVVTDEGENQPPYFVETLKQYRHELKADPSVVFVRTPGASSYLEDHCRAAGIPADAYKFEGDYYALPNLVPLLARPSRRELLTEILDYPLPVRRPA